MMGIFAFFVFWVIVVFGIGYFNYCKSEDKKIAWQDLATMTGLKFVQGDFFSGSYVTGRCKNNHIMLETVEKKQGRSSTTYTRISVSVILYEQISNVPNPSSVTDFDHLLKPSTNKKPVLRGKVKLNPGLKNIEYEQPGLETDIKYLITLFDYLGELVELHRMVLLGGEAVPVLEKIIATGHHKLQDVALELLREIGHQTTRKFDHRTSGIVCLRCLTRFGEHKVRLSWWESVSYYGCRMCKQSKDFFKVAEPVTVTLDSQMPAEYLHVNDSLKINWLYRRELFDFDQVEIAQASDEDVERFAVQVGNDTDPHRDPYYGQMRVVIDPNCNISENSHRVLQQMFGRVEREKAMAY